MESFQNLKDDDLIDLLASYTAKYTQMIAERDMGSQDFYDCKLMVKCLQNEIEARRHPSDNNQLFLQA